MCTCTASGHEGVGLSVSLEAEPDGHGAVGLAAHDGAGPVRHLDDVGRLDNGQAIAMNGERGQLAVEQVAQLRFHDGGLSHELNAMSGIELGERQQRAGYGRLGSEIAPHGVQRDPRQDQASLAATRCSPA